MGQPMRKPIPTRRFFEGVKGQMTFRDQLSELTGSLKDIGILRRTPSLEAVKSFWMA